MKYLTSNPFTWVTVAILLLATAFNHFWVWGALFLWWSVTSFMAGQAFIGTVIARRDNPPLFFVVTAMWLGLGGYYLVQDIAWRFFQIYIG